MIRPERVHFLNRDAEAAGGGYVLYWMQQSQRADGNHALEYTLERANQAGLPALVCFGLDPAWPAAGLRHYVFMLEGLRETAALLAERGIAMIIERGDPVEVALRHAARARLVVTDRGYTRRQRDWRRILAERAGRTVIELESDLVVPVQTAYPKQAWSAAVLRPKLAAAMPVFLDEPEPVEPRRTMQAPGPSLDLSDPHGLAASLGVGVSIGPLRSLRGGSGEAARRLGEFIARKLDRFALDRNDPSVDGLSNLSPYLHFGQIGAVGVARRILDSGSPGAPGFIEEFVVRRELAINFAWYNPAHDRPEGLPDWARRSLDAHAGDARPYLYSAAELASGATHDPAWNAAQLELSALGKMHGYLRMYWGKKILEWSPTWREGWRIALAMNDAHSLDGRDPNGYAGVAWCFGAHDRPWRERPVFGMVRYMNEAGLRRKFHVDRYIERVGERVRLEALEV